MIVYSMLSEPPNREVLIVSVFGSRALCLAVSESDDREDGHVESMDTCHVVSSEDVQAAAARQKALHEAFGQILCSKVLLIC